MMGWSQVKGGVVHGGIGAPVHVASEELLFTSERVAIHGRIGGIAAFVALHVLFK